MRLDILMRDTSHQIAITVLAISRIVFGVALVAPLSVFLSPCTTRAAASPRPNIVMIIVDDLGWCDVSANRKILGVASPWRCRTRHIDRLAAEGVLFTHARSAAVCTPTRVSIMTGLCPARHRVTTWINARDLPSEDGNGPKLLAPKDWNFNGLQPKGIGLAHSLESVTLVSRLRSAGYTTIHLGKSHWGAMGTPGADATTLGFDVSIACSGHGGIGSYLGSDRYKGSHRIPAVPDLDAYHGSDTFLTDALTQEAVAQLRVAVAAKRPFFLHLSHHAVHAPLMADSKFVSSERRRGGTERQAIYSSMIRGVDESVGRVLAELAALGVEDRTVVVFVSDNGGLNFDDIDNNSLRGEKGTAYDGGLRVPLIIRCPGIAKRGVICKVNVVAQDLFPTFCAFARSPDLSDRFQAVDGQDITPLLTGGVPVAPERPLVFHQPHYHQGNPFSAIILDRWKLILWHDGSKAELYDVCTDVGEARNLFSAHRERAQKMADTLVDFLRQADAQFPVDRRTGHAVRCEDLLNSF